MMTTDRCGMVISSRMVRWGVAEGRGMAPTAPVYAGNGSLYRGGSVEYQHNPSARRETILTAVARRPSGHPGRSRHWPSRSAAAWWRSETEVAILDLWRR